MQIRGFFEDSKAKVEISDTGVGINNDDAYKIFEPGITSKPTIINNEF